MGRAWQNALFGGPIFVAVCGFFVLRRFAERGANVVSLLTAALGVTIATSVIAIVPFDVWEVLVLNEAQSPESSGSLPIDAAGNSDAELQLQLLAPVLHRSWQAVYWVSFFLCSFICPVLMEFEGSGDFSVGAKLRAGCRRLSLIYALYVVIFIIVVISLLVTQSVQGSLESWCIAGSTAWGLLQLTVLMGYGLVAVPRHLWELSDPALQLRRLYVRAVARDEARLSRIFELQDVVGQARATLLAADADADADADATAEIDSVCGGMDSAGGGGGSSATAAETVDRATARRRARAISTFRKTLERCEQLHKELTTRRTCVDEEGSSLHCGGAGSQGRKADGTELEEGGLPGPPTRTRADIVACSPTASTKSPGIDQMAELHRSLKVAALEAKRASCRWDSHVRRCLFFEVLQAGHFRAAAEQLAGRPRCVLGGDGGCSSRLARTVSLCWNRLLIFWLRSLRGRVLRLLGVLSGILSILVVLGQLTMFSKRWSLSVLSVFFLSDHGPLLTPLLCVVPLSYMAYTAYFTIFRLKIAGWYGLYGNHNTDMPSLLWCASLLARLAAPLSYHFLALIRVRGTTFQAFFGQMNVVPFLGESVNEVFPCVVAGLCCCNLLNVHSRFAEFMSFGLIDSELGLGLAGDGEDPFADGRQLVERERRRIAEGSQTELRSRSEPERLSIPLAAVAAG